jgi:hypothetical protein
MLCVNKGKNKAKQEYWFEQIRLWQSSGLRQVEFCKHNKLNVHTFVYWRVRFLKSKDKTISKNEKVTFLPAVIHAKKNAESTQSITGSGIVIVFPNQLKLLVPTDLPQMELLSIIKNLGGIS